MKLYYIENKIFSLDKHTVIYQFADSTILPKLYTSKNKALRKAQRLTDYLAENCRFEVTIDTDKISATKDSCLYAATLKERQSSFFEIIRVYEVKTR